MPELQIDAIAKDYGATRALHPVSITVEKGEFVTILGPSGCGKSTLLRIIMGIIRSSEGRIELGGKRIDMLPPEARDIAMVFQSYALFPHMSVVKNLGFGLRMKNVAKPERARRILHALDICNLNALVDRMPRQLSGGQQQRVALARAIVMEPRLLLFDEPLSNLDAKLRDTLRQELVDLHRRIGATSVYVTHDQAEAMAMSDRIVLMNNGRIVEVGTPLDLYRTPQHVFTAGFLGQTNIVAVDAEGGEALLPWGQRTPLSVTAKGLVKVSIRPETIRIAANDAGEGVVSDVSFLGPNAVYTVKIGADTLKVSQAGVATLLAPGARVTLDFDTAPHVLSDAWRASEAV